MEQVEMDLKKILDQHTKSMDDEHVKTIFYNLLCAIQFMHSSNIIHRDIKPANILIDLNCNVKICDFGLSRSLNKRSDVETEALEHQRILYNELGTTDNKEFKNQMARYLT